MTPRSSKRRSGFTLIELLVTIGIIVLLASIALPMLYKAWRSAARTRQAADLNALATALEAYRGDFGDYPRVDATGTGFAALGKALASPGPASTLSPPSEVFPVPVSPFQAGTVGLVGSGTGAFQFVASRNTVQGVGTSPDWITLGYADGADGPGFRVRVGGGTVRQPYLAPGKFRMHGLAILDINGFPILYFPKNSANVNLAATTGNFYVSSFPVSVPAIVGGLGPADRTMYNFDDDGYLATQLTPEDDSVKALVRMQVMMGIREDGNLAISGNARGRINQGTNSPATTNGFVLWSVGADGFFGPREDVATIRTDRTAVDNAVRRADDVTNFNLGQ